MLFDKLFGNEVKGLTPNWNCKIVGGGGGDTRRSDATDSMRYSWLHQHRLGGQATWQWAPCLFSCQSTWICFHLLFSNVLFPARDGWSAMISPAHGHLFSRINVWTLRVVSTSSLCYRVLLGSQFSAVLGVSGSMPVFWYRNKLFT